MSYELSSSVSDEHSEMQSSCCDEHGRSEREVVSNSYSSLHRGTDGDSMCRSVSETSDYSVVSLTSQNEIWKLQFQDSELGLIWKQTSDPKLSVMSVRSCALLLYYENPDLPGRLMIAVSRDVA